MNEYDSLPRNVRWEILNISNFGAIESQSIKFEKNSSDDSFIVKLNFNTDILLLPIDKKILDIEPILLKYRSIFHVGVLAPEVLSDRANFPRNLQHLNPTSADQPASLCLVRSGKQELYNRKGVYGILERLNEWLNDAKTETLYEDGWDPIPYSAKNIASGIIDSGSFQNLAGMNTTGGFSYFMTDVLAYENGSKHLKSVSSHIADNNLVQLNVNTISLKKATIHMSQKPKKLNNSYLSRIPGIFCWANSSEIQHDAYYSSWVDVESLKKGLKKLGMLKPLIRAKLNLEEHFKLPNQNNKNGFDQIDPDNKGLMICIGLWRPTYIDPTIIGLSRDPTARNLELRFFFLERKKNEKNPISKNGKLSEVITCEPPSSKLYSEVSGELPLPSTTFLGAGALGSKFINSALRGGLSKLTVVDEDSIMPHNVARHAGGLSDIHMYKTDYIELMAKDIVPNVDITKHKENILDIKDNLASILRQNELIIDSTANPLVSKIISQIDGPRCKLFKAEIFNKGKLGVCFFTALGSSYSINFLYYQLILLAKDKRYYFIAEWLKYESSKSFLDEELLLGFGCTSTTTKMPDYIVSIHANVVFSAIKKILSSNMKSGVFINPINDDGLPLAAEFIEAPNVIVFESNGNSDWKVIVNEEVLKEMHKIKELNSPIEAGGYMYGTINEQLSEIYILDFFDYTKEANSSMAHIDLGRSGQIPLEKTFIRRTSNNLMVVGVWHSHPTSAPNPSSTDIATFNSFISQDRKLGVPTVMAISGANEDKFYVYEDLIPTN